MLVSGVNECLCGATERMKLRGQSEGEINRATQEWGKWREKRRKLKLKAAAAAAEGVNRRERFIAKLSWDAEKPR